MRQNRYARTFFSGPVIDARSTANATNRCVRAGCRRVSFVAASAYSVCPNSNRADRNDAPFTIRSDNGRPTFANRNKVFRASYAIGPRRAAARFDGDRYFRNASFAHGRHCPAKSDRAYAVRAAKAASISAAAAAASVTDFFPARPRAPQA